VEYKNKSCFRYKKGLHWYPKKSEIKLELAEGKQKIFISLDDFGIIARSSNKA